LDAQADGADAEAEAKAAEQRMALRQMLIDDAIAAMKDAHETHQHGMQSIQTTMQIGDATNVAISSFGRV
jgi:hypothetical protein